MTYTSTMTDQSSEDPAMTIDVTAARSFVAGHARILDRRRLTVLLDDRDQDGVLRALEGYRNADGGYGWGLEPDLRSPESQPTAAMHALEVFAELAPIATPSAAETCDWLEEHSRPDGGLPFAMPITDPAGCAPWWLDPDTETSNLQMTTQVAANAHLVARHDPAVRDHPWLARATEWCLSAIGGLQEAPGAHELLFSARFLDAAADAEPRALELLDRIARFIPSDGVVPVRYGADGEAIRALDLAPRGDGPARRLFAPEVVDRELRRLATMQQPDGGWTVDFESATPAAALEWRGYVTVEALTRLLVSARP